MEKCRGSLDDFMSTEDTQQEYIKQVGRDTKFHFNLIHGDIAVEYILLVQQLKS